MDFLKELPVFDKNNFAKFQADSNPQFAVYIPTQDYPSKQIIIQDSIYARSQFCEICKMLTLQHSLNSGRIINCRDARKALPRQREE
ncbi:DET1- and DDB1-associated protein 1-like [Hippocampus zosterae]|uniref:DET1- and DDB1-associated protein 1-like n=1 Tax=Hippocampus zosterae TaxID=109293 RepID=UPI00223E19A0|nr:DET1- and DDB1-associated protein 1-like [Hippocampus zosterae]